MAELSFPKIMRELLDFLERSQLTGLFDLRAWYEFLLQNRSSGSTADSQVLESSIITQLARREVLVRPDDFENLRADLVELLRSRARESTLSSREIVQAIFQWQEKGEFPRLLAGSEKNLVFSQEGSLIPEQITSTAKGLNDQLGLSKSRNFFEEYSGWHQFYIERFEKLARLLKSNLSLHQKELLVEDRSDFQEKKLCIGIGFVEQAKTVQVKHGNLNTIDQELEFHCVHLSKQYQLIVNIGVKELRRHPISSFPAGIVAAFSGEIQEVSVTDHFSTVRMKATNIILPSFPQEKTLSPGAELSPLSSGNAVWMLVIGALGLGLASSWVPLQNLFTWLTRPPEKYRLYCTVFVGGILSPLLSTSYPSKKESRVLLDPPIIRESYQRFLALLGRLPENLRIFIVPGEGDITRKFLPQPPIAESTVRLPPNIHFLGNPARICIEGKEILLFNPFPFFNLPASPYKEKAAKVLFELLEFRYLYPDWGQIHPFPHSPDQFVIEKIPDIILASHPSKTQIPTYRNILGVTVAPFEDSATGERIHGVLVNLNNPMQREIVLL